MIRFTDSVKIGEVKRTKEGYVSAFARAVRTGVQDYGAWENEHWLDLARAVGKGPNDTVSVYRPPESVFSKDSLKSAIHIPVTLNHPPVMVDSSNWSEYAIGETGSDVMRDGELVAFSLMLKDERGTKAFDDGVVELSAGYIAALDKAPSGSHYDYVMGPPEYNHLALVPAGRAGAKARIGDSAENWGAMPINLNDRKDSKLDMVKLMVGDKAVQVAASDADIVTGLVKDHISALGLKDKEIGELTVKLSAAEAKVISDADLAKLVDAKVKANTERAAVKAKIGDKADAMTDAQIEGAFLALDGVAEVNDDARRVLADRKPIADADERIKAAQKKFLNPEAK